MRQIRRPPGLTIVGRGHSGTRAISRTLAESGVFMGAPLNASSDLIPPEDMYEACRVMAPFVEWHGGLDWSWDRCLRDPVPDRFTALLDRYLCSVHASDSPLKGWKIPETTLVYPWIRRLYPDMKFIFWVRDPRDCILGGHVTDDLASFGIPYPPTADPLRRRAISWLYQYRLVRAVPLPDSWIEVRFEDFVLHQERTLCRLETFLGFPLARIPVDPGAVGRYLRAPDHRDFDFLEAPLAECGYR